MDPRGAAHAADEDAVDRVGERVQEGQAPRPRQEGLLGRVPVAGVPVPLEEVLREPPHVADLVEELEHPEGAPELVPAVGRGPGDLLREVPGEVEGVGAVEHAEVVGLAPDDLLAAGADAEGQVPELEVDVELAQLVVELERVALAAREAAHLEHAARKAEELSVLVERHLVAVGAAVDVLLLDEARGGVVDAVVDAAPDDRQVRGVDEGDVVLVVELAGLEPVVVEVDVGDVPVHDELVRVLVGRADDVHRLEVARELDRPELLRCSGGRRDEAGEHRERDSNR